MCRRARFRGLWVVSLGLFGCVGDDPVVTPTVGDAAAAPTADAGDAGSRNSYCANYVGAFCADFDDGGAVDDGWSERSNEGGCQFAAFTRDFHSAPRSVEFRCEATATGHATLTRTIEAKGRRRLRAELAFWLNDNQSEAAFLQLFANDDQPLSVRSGATGWWLTNGFDSTAPSDLQPKPTAGSWHRATIDAIFAPEGGVVRIGIDGTQVVNLTQAVTGPAQVNTMSLRVGVQALGPLPRTLSLLVDDVTLAATE